MNPTPEESLFQAALQLGSGQSRSAFLDQACAGDSALRARLTALLAAHEAPTAVIKDPQSAKRRAATIALDLPEVEDEAIGEVLGRYKLLEKVGEGGCGVVYVAEQTEPVRRRVALKVIKLGMDTKAVVARFGAERQALAMMDHPNIAKVLDAGTTDKGRPYFVMELVRGIRITDYCDQEKLSTKDRLALFIKVCQAIQHAHQKGIIHRDIKPSNILVSFSDGVPVPKVIDFGIAKATEGRLTNSTVYTELHQFIGTPAYMSPEQAEMSGLDIDTLGVLLYELLAGITPFDPKDLIASGIDAMRKTIREKEPVRPSTRFAALKGDDLTTTAIRRSSDTARLLHQLQGDLDWIVMKCLEKDRTRRYETANGLAADLKRHLNNELVLARPPSVSYKVQKAIRRNKLAFAAVGAIALALLLGAVVSASLAVTANHARKDAENALFEQARLRKAADQARLQEKELRSLSEQQRIIAVKKELETRKILYASDMLLAAQAMEDNRRGYALRILEKYRPKSNQHSTNYVIAEPDLRGWEWRYLMRTTRSQELFTLGAHSNSVGSMACSPDGQFLATSGSDRTIRLFDLLKHQQVAVFTDSDDQLPSLGAIGSQLSFSSDGRRLLTRGDKFVAIFDPKNLERSRFQVLTRTNVILHAGFLPDSGKISVFSSGESFLWDPAALSISSTKQIPEGYAIVPFPDGRNLGVYSRNAFREPTFMSWDSVSGAASALQVNRALHGNVVAFSPDGRKIVENGPSGREVTVRLLSDDSVLAVITNSLAWCPAMAFSKDGSFLACGWTDQSLRVYDTKSWEQIAVLRGNLDEIYCLAFTPDSKMIFTGSKDGAVKAWSNQRAKEDSEPVHLKQKDHPFVTVSLDGLTVLSPTDAQGRRQTWSTLSQETLARDILTDKRSFPLESFPPRTWSSKFESVVGKNSAGNLSVSKLQSSARDVELESSSETFLGLGFSRDTRLIAGLSSSYELVLWNASTGRIQARQSVPSSSGSSMIYLVTDQGVVAGSAGFDGFVWDSRNPARPFLILSHRSPVTDIAISPDGRTVASSGYDALIKCWDAKTGMLLATLEGDPSAFNSVSFSPDGRRIVGSGYGCGVYIWDAEDFRFLAVLKGHQSPVDAAFFTPDNSHLVSFDPQEIIIWTADPPEAPR